MERDADSTAMLNTQAQRRAAWMPHSEGSLPFRLHPSLLSEAFLRVRRTLFLAAE
jgi:hypothetical protein